MSEQIHDPNKRYLRCELINESKNKKVYRTLDKEEAISADWVEFAFDGISNDNLENLKRFISIYSKINNPNLIKIYKAWIDPSRHLLIYISEQFSNVTIRNYIKNVVHNAGCTVISKWCVQVISAIEQLHMCDPPIQHNNLSCDSIFIDPSEGIIKVDVPILDSIIYNSVPPLAAPEAQRGFSVPKSDIWSLGLCVIEMATSEIPYSEFTNLASVRTSILAGVLPTAIAKISDPSVADFVTTCLLPVNQRPTASQLHEYSLISDFYDYKVPCPSPKSIPAPQNEDKLKVLLEKHRIEKEALKEKHLTARKELRMKILLKRARL